MDKEALLKMPESDYMDAVQTEYFKALLVKLALEKTEALEVAREQLGALGNPSDVSDLGTVEETRSMLGRTIDRANQSLLEIRTSLRAIADGEYGWCAQTGEAIGLERLIANPTARLCADAQALKEQVRKHHAA
ncbi:TraR/DksA family transcriptional regulator [Pseudomonas sp. GOM6]|uniref:TraR/DksA family transcriptional regulator n=1 Tax=Pseudomonas sp. GOM6 TaxID=3036944 RepID=UPI00240956EE|nr:TraR/DksA family transcriptional regulator [Pseudomonas sp. GOM6]MDG1580824.1 TraR/DksA family transcriptional regulator [Pseudomonas sp. GOM6]